MRKLLAVVIIFLALLLVLRGFWNLQLSAVSSDKIPQRVVIAKGSGLNQIAQQLKREKLVRSAFIFSLYARKMGLASKISAGTFSLSSSMSMPKIVEILSGVPNEVWVTIVEGWRVEEIAEELNSKFEMNNLPSAERNSKFLALAEEGYMFPDTYLFAKDATAEQIAKTMRDNFEKKYSPKLRDKIKSHGLTEDEGVILASIVEREARSDSARRMAASILLKRVKIGMGLNADATVQYALGYQPQEKSFWKRYLNKDDFKIDSPYNTYLYSGLPPTPISNPGLSSLQAVGDADASVPYLYYYHDSQGRAHYAKTLQEHNENIANNP